MTGQRYGRLVVLPDVIESRDGNDRVLCRCDCGELAKVITSNLQNGRTRSCGCLRSESSSRWMRRLIQRKIEQRARVLPAEPGPIRVRVLRGLKRLDWPTSRELFAAIGVPWLSADETTWRERNLATHTLTRCVRSGLAESRGAVGSRQYRITPAGRAWLAKQLARADVGVATEEEAA